VRLKGGDPFIFGRGGEEMEAARAAGIRVEVVPGISAANGAAAAAGIALTHREDASVVSFVAGQCKGLSEQDWAGLAGKGRTLRGWQASLFAEQQRVVTTLGTSAGDRELIFGGNFNRLFP
jgi:precorrin-4 methylase